ncbi:snare-like protein [Trematosphaeria pertusa]|uniref:Protein transport protein SEC22 n=1 Tax=Trematosphaeria pertusa TaxID=390896 RepID=A0A6A6IKG1_9PLEO|nr:snare-like protein [Trematosphaeria pertusa]KAF2250568.1 snare-like protein [Trematosphaeria pertusa]
MIKMTWISRVDDGIILASGGDETKIDAQLQEATSRAKLIQRRMNRNSEPQASVETGAYTYHYIVKDGLCYLTLCERSYPRKLAFAYLADLANEFNVSHQPSDYLAPGVKSFAYVGFERTIHKTMKTYQDSRMPANLDRLNDELKDVTKVMTKNIEDLLYRGDSLERMGDISSRLREDSRKYRKAAVRINWELLLKQYGPVGALVFIIIVFIWWRFF